MKKDNSHKNGVLFHFIYKHLELIQVTLLMLALITSLFPIGDFLNIVFDTSFNDTKLRIVSLLAIITIEFFVITNRYLEPIAKSTEKIDKIVELTSKVSYSLKPCNFEELNRAQNCIFISGAGMHAINIDNNRRLLAAIASKVKINLAVLNYDNEDVIKVLKDFFGNTDEELISNRTQFNEGVSYIENRRGVNVITLKNIFIPIAYCAIDYRKETESSSSFIQAKHYSLSDEKPFFCTVRPGVDLYEYYRNQILIMENQYKS